MFASSRTATAFARQTTRAFSTTPTCRSKIGSAPLSLPQEVQFNIIPRSAAAGGAPARTGRRGVSLSGQGSTVEIVGPLGTMKMEIPAYMSIQENEANRTRTLHILDAEDRKQREMWGEWLHCIA
jgi:large subunit ribosomal protein L6